GAEARDDVAARERLEVLALEARARAARGGRVEARVGIDLLLLGRPQDAGGGGELLLGEEAGLSVAHGERGPAVDVAVVVEEEEADVALLRVAVDVDVV